MTTYTLAIADQIELPIKFSVNDGGTAKSFAFKLKAKRMTQAALRAVFKDADILTRDLLTEQIVGWSGQRLVLDDDGEPAEFSAGAFEALLSLVGMENLVYGAYLKAMGVEAPAEKAKN